MKKRKNDLNQILFYISCVIKSFINFGSLSVVFIIRIPKFWSISVDLYKK